MSLPRDREKLDEECRRLTRFLLGVDPTEYVARKYAEAHSALPALLPASRFDELLVRCALGPAVLARPAAAFARVFEPRSALQHKLVTLLAILETAPVTATVVDSVPHTSVPRLLFGLSVRGSIAAFALVAGTLLLLPVRALLNGRRSHS